MSISDLFAYLGAPLINKRWSWGSVRPSDGAVFLRVWQDLKFIDSEGRRYMQICGLYEDDSATPGYPERVQHTEAIREGAPCFMVMCVAADTETPKRQIISYDDKDIFVGGDVIQTDAGFAFPPNTSERTKYFARGGATWVRVAGRIRADEVRAE
jgi:hypothetical protein